MASDGWASELTAGRFEEVTFASAVLAGNPLGDPPSRPLWVYLPPGYDEDSTQRYPSVYVIQGFNGALPMWKNRMPFQPTFPEACDALFASGDAPACIVVWVDAWTSVGGSQFVDSPGTGSYHTYICDEVVPWVDAHYRTLAAARHRGIQGKSSGGFGAMITPMLRPDLFGALATHAGDSLYEYCYLPEFGKVVRALRAYDGDIEAWWADFTSRPAFTKPDDGLLLGIYGVAACFSAAAGGTVQLPFDPRTGVLVADQWDRWLAWDPVRMVPRYADALRGLRGIWIDAGTRDEYFLDLGAEAFRAALADIGVTDLHFELIDSGHGNLGFRYPMSLRYLAARLAPEPLGKAAQPAV